MAASVRLVDYYYATVQDRPGQAAELLRLLASGSVELLAFAIAPSGPTHAQLMLFPEDSAALLHLARRAGLSLTGPQHAFLVQGDFELGAMLDIHERLADEEINVYSSSGVCDRNGGFGYLLFLRPEDVRRAAVALGPLDEMRPRTESQH